MSNPDSDRCPSCGCPDTPSTTEQWHHSSDECDEAEEPCPNWGNWLLRKASLVLMHRACWYEVDLERVTSSAHMLDWIYQIHGKTWASDQDMSDLLTAFKDIFDPQGSMCSGGTERSSRETLNKLAKQSKKLSAGIERKRG